MRAFLEDFGFTCFEQDGRLYARGSDGRPFLHVTEPGEPGFRGLGLRARTIEDLETLAKAEGVPVEESSEPGGGKVVRLTDPDGFRVEVVAGQVKDAAANPVIDQPRNTASARTRLRQLVRLDPGPSHVKRIGHAVLSVSDFRASEKWYKDRFGLLTSDEVEAARDVPLGAFMRCDRGDKPADHHTLFLAQMPGPRTILHAAFEVANLDDLMLGHQHLKARKRTPFWGVGRHILGSQVFDYWKDPWGHELEHWTDGDLLTAADPPNTMPLSALLAVQWGSPFPALSGKAVPPIGLLAFLMALRLRIARLFRPKSKEFAA
jgi:catechol 2,3-dioxygenase-like lactoylglutathione lyase family enzyme